jgi:hypothetical protein
MEREGIEKAGFEGLMSGVQGMGIRGGKAENLEKKGAERRWRKSQKPHTPNPRMVETPQRHCYNLRRGVRVTRPRRRGKVKHRPKTHA